LPLPAHHLFEWPGENEWPEKKDELISACFALSLLKLQLAGPGENLLTCNHFQIQLTIWKLRKLS
jgi:hypothetical protein